MLLPAWKDVKRLVVGMVHAPPLPGSPRYEGPRRKIVDAVLRDADALVAGGVDGLLLENFGDAPFHADRVPSHVVADLASLAVRLNRFSVPLGVNVLRNDATAALSIAAACEAQFIRVNVLCGVRLTDQGIVQGRADELLRLQRTIDAADVRILADVDVKHSAPLAPRDLQQEVDDLLHRGLADGLIVSGSGTGRATDPAQVAAVRASAGDCPLLVGSGVTCDTASLFHDQADGVIVGTAMKQNGDPQAPVDRRLVEQLVRAFKG